MIAPEEVCSVGSCNESAERAHLLTRATLSKRQWDNPVFYIFLCRRHHFEAHQIGIETFCAKYGFSMELERARKALFSSR